MESIKEVYDPEYVPASVSPEQQELYIGLKNKFDQMMNDLDFGIDFFGRCGDFADKIRQEHPEDNNNCRLVHLLCGSGLRKDIPITRFDYEGEDSVVSFINKEYENFQKK